MRVLVTGGAGYVGISLLRALVSDDRIEEIVVYDNLSRRHYELFFAGTVESGGRIKFVQGDILDGRTMDRVFSDIDVLYHLAAKVTTPNSDLDAHSLDQVNNWGSAQVVRSAEKSDSLQRLVYLSSMAVYGSGPEPFSADTRPQPYSMYGISKLRGEQHFQRLTDRSVHIVRAANVFGFGPAIRFDAVVNKMALEARFNGRVAVHGSGEQMRPFVHVDRLAAGLVGLLDEPQDGVAIAADHNRSVTQIVAALQGKIPDLDILFVDQDARMGTNSALLPTPLLDRVGPTPDFDDEIESLLGMLRL